MSVSMQFDESVRTMRRSAVQTQLVQGSTSRPCALLFRSLLVGEPYR
jgi:hypothetical protein